MPESRGPWDLPPPPEPPPRRREGWRPLVLVALIAGAVAAIWALSRAFPGQVTGTDWFYPLNLLGFLLLIGSAALISRRLRIGQIIRYLSAWTLIALVLLAGYTFRDDLTDLGPRLRSELIPSYATPSAPGAVALSQNADGAYEVVGTVNDQPVRFVIDTGASDIVLSPADARRIGIDPDALDFSRRYETANGAGRGARVKVDSVAVGPVRLRHVQVSVNQAEMGESLLGMAFLRRLDSFEFRRGQLILRAAKS